MKIFRSVDVDSSFFDGIDQYLSSSPPKRSVSQYLEKLLKSINTSLLLVEALFVLNCIVSLTMILDVLGYISISKVGFVDLTNKTAVYLCTLSGLMFTSVIFIEMASHSVFLIRIYNRLSRHVSPSECLAKMHLVFVTSRSLAIAHDSISTTSWIRSRPTIHKYTVLLFQLASCFIPATFFAKSLLDTRDDLGFVCVLSISTTTLILVVHKFYYLKNRYIYIYK